MDGELVSGSLSLNVEGGGSKTTPLKTYTETFNELFPYYLSIGMSAEQYWDGDSQLVIYYRKAEELRAEKVSFEAWLQGKYIYDALCMVSPILHAYAKKGTKPVPYVEEPYPVTKARAMKISEDKEKAKYEKNKAFFEAFAKGFNQKFEKGR